MYVDAGRKSFYKGLSAAVETGRVTHIRSKLNPADHCDECVALEYRWYKIGSEAWVPPGFRECRTNCKCSEEYGTEQADGSIKVVGAA
jgi:hypothetical protein